MAQTRVSQFFKRKSFLNERVFQTKEKENKIKGQKSSINVFCVEKDNQLFDAEVICLDPCKKEEKRPVGRAKKHNT